MPQSARLPSWLREWSLPGLVFALVGYVVSVTPSLIPRTWAFQAFVSGISVVVGYALGAFLGWLVRVSGLRDRLAPSAGNRVSRAVGVLAALVVVTFTALGARWQTRLRSLFGMDDVTFWYALVPVAAVAIGLPLILVARAARTSAVRLIRLTGLRTGTPASYAVATMTALALTYLTVSGAVGSVIMGGVRGVSEAVDSGTDPDIARPQQFERSGSPESSVNWEGLGRQGRRFVATGPTRDELAAFWSEFAFQGDGRDVREPIRVFAGLESADSLTDVADLVVDELNRTGAWDREVLVLVTTTGSGWVDPAMADTIELMFGGDTAIAAMQYTYLPSWAGFLSDQDLPPKAAKALFDAVHAEWSRHAVRDRPELYVFGESIGSYGGQDAFTDFADLTGSVDGALWAGTPHISRMWQTLTAARDLGSPESAPVYAGGRHVRWSVAASEVRDVGSLDESLVSWQRPRVLYLQHPSDVVTWWSTDLIWQRPDWLSEPRGHDVLDELQWLPALTFWQLSFDLTHATDVTAGYGHKYWFEYIDAWAALADPPGWDAAARERLYDLMAERALAEEVMLPSFRVDHGKVDEQPVGN